MTNQVSSETMGHDVDSGPLFSLYLMQQFGLKSTGRDPAKERDEEGKNCKETEAVMANLQWFADFVAKFLLKFVLPSSECSNAMDCD